MYIVYPQMDDGIARWLPQPGSGTNSLTFEFFFFLFFFFLVLPFPFATHTLCFLWQITSETICDVSREMYTLYICLDAMCVPWIEWSLLFIYFFFTVLFWFRIFYTRFFFYYSFRCNFRGLGFDRQEIILK